MTKFYSPAHERRMNIPLRSWDDEEVRRFIEIETYLILKTIHEAYGGSYASFQLLETFCEISNCSKDLLKKHYDAYRKGYARPTVRERVVFGLYKGWSIERIRTLFRMEYSRVSKEIVYFFDGVQPKSAISLLKKEDSEQLERFNQTVGQFVYPLGKLFK